MKKAIYCLLAILCPLITLFAQLKTKISKLSIGQTVPNITFRNMVNYGNGQINLSDFGGRIVILDFFATWCGGCVAGLPRLDSLQKKFGDRIQIIIATNQPADKITAFLMKNKKLQNLSLPFITSDSLLKEMFPYRLIPHEVWLDGNLKIRAITGSEEVTEHNINKLLSDAPFLLPLKRDIMDFDRNNALLESGNGGDSKNILFRSTVIGFLDGVGNMAGRSLDTAAKTQRIYYINYQLQKLYMEALGKLFPPNLTLIDTSHISKSSSNPSKAIFKQLFCYEQVSPLGSPRQKQREWMLQDLNRFFLLDGRVEKRTVTCYVLNKNGQSKKKIAVSPTALENENFVTSQTWANLVGAVNSNSDSYMSPFYVDDTDIKLKEAPLYSPLMQDEQKLKILVAEYGLAITKTKRELDILIISSH